MGEMKPRLVWVAEYDDDSDYLSVMERLDTQGQYEGVTICRLHGEESADLIAEAGTVFHNTGLSPVQLVEQRDELLVVMREFVERFGPTRDAQIFSKRMAIDKARAALAKCEGVK